MSETSPHPQPNPTGPVSIHKLFPVCVMEVMLEDASALNAALKKVILDNKARSPGVARSNILGWHSDTEMLQWGGPPAQKLALTMLQICGQRTDDVGMRGGQPRYEMAMEMWANVSPHSASNQFHAHPGCLWSGVYYVDNGGDEDASLVLMDPNFPMNRMYAPDLQFVGDGGERFPSRREFAPTPGKLVIFPSWLNHAVKPNQAAGERISIAMNVLALPVRPSPGG
ncbi:MAG: TIGR02466 family protein [Pseudomonadota bacterium]